MKFPVVKSLLKGLTAGLVATLVFFVVGEALLRVIYYIRNSMVDYVPDVHVFMSKSGPAPPWIDGLRVLEPDEALLWRNRPNARRKRIDIFGPAHTEEERNSLIHQFLPGLPTSYRENPVWDISLNSAGFREVEFPDRKAPAVFRIICLGDSWTFGHNVAQDEAYPQRLRALLKQEFPEANFEILNIGVPGYSSYQGVKLLKRFTTLEPDVVVIAYAINDLGMTGFHAEDISAVKVVKKIAGLMEHVELYKLLRYWALLLKWKPNTIGEYLRNMPDYVSWKENEAKTSSGNYEKNHLEMINLASSHDAGAILLYNDFWRGSPYLKTLEKISSEKTVPLIDSSALLVEAQKRIEKGLETELKLRPDKGQMANANGEIEVVFRVYLGDRPVPKGIYIVGNHVNFGNVIPNKVAMYDDGTRGDQKAGDKVWSYSARFSPGTVLFYVYTNSGEEGKWEGLDVPDIRTLQVEARHDEEKVYTPIESFGKIYMKSDRVHTNAAGYEVIAQALLEELKKDERFKRYLGQTAAKGIRKGS